MKTDTLALQHSNLNAFLFADVGTETNGMALSVLSMLARFDLDPWQEASRLAGLSRTKSIEAVAGLIRSMPAGTWSLAEAVPIATRLAVLLPQHADIFGAFARPFPMRAASPSRSAATGRQPVRVGTGTALTNIQWLGVLTLLSALFAGLAAGVILRPSDRLADPGAASQATGRATGVRSGSPVGSQVVLRTNDRPRS